MLLLNIVMMAKFVIFTYCVSYTWSACIHSVIVFLWWDVITAHKRWSDFLTLQTPIITKAVFVLFAVGSSETRREFIMSLHDYAVDGFVRAEQKSQNHSILSEMSFGGSRSICRILWRNLFWIVADAGRSVVCFRRILTRSRLFEKISASLKSSLFVDTLCVPTNNEI